MCSLGNFFFHFFKYYYTRIRNKTCVALDFTNIEIADTKNTY